MYKRHYSQWGREVCARVDSYPRDLLPAKPHLYGPRCTDATLMGRNRHRHERAGPHIPLLREQVHEGRRTAVGGHGCPCAREANASRPAVV